MKQKLPQLWCKIATLALKHKRMSPILCLAMTSLLPLSAVAEKQITMSISPEELSTWNDIYTPTNITFSGEYVGDNVASVHIEYSINDADFSNPIVLSNNVKPGETFSAEVPISFSYQKVYSIYFRAVDYDGNIYSYSPIEIYDIWEVEFDEPIPKIYDGEAYCPEITANGFGKDWVSVEYADNINAGTAYANLSGVFPHTVGWTSVSYQITPATLEGEIVLTKTEYDFTGGDIWPEYTLEGPVKDISESDGYSWWSENWYMDGIDNHYATNDARVVITGYGNYAGTITSEPFTINKINYPESWIGYGVPDADLTFDGEPHEAWAWDIDGMGEKIISYVNQENVSTTEAPSEAGTYDVYLEYTEGPGIYSIPQRNIGQFSIYNLDEDDWKSLVALREELQKDNKDNLWVWEYLNEGITGVPRLKEYGLLDIEKGQIRSFG